MTAAPARPRDRLARAVRLGLGALLLAGALALGLLGAGFVWFARAAIQEDEAPLHADGIVVLTGGPDRVETGLRLLVGGRADRLLISGLGHGVELADLARRGGLEPAKLQGRVSLGRAATSTRTNALETAEWARANGIRTAIVVTAGYHMPRALVELHRTLPDLVFFPTPVLSPVVSPGRPAPAGSKWPSPRLLGEEYMKWLVAWLGLSGYAPTHEPHGPAGSGNGPSG